MNTYTGTSESDHVRKHAYRRVRAKRNLLSFLLLWAVTTVIVITVWAFVTPDSYFWPMWPIGGMGFAAMFMAIDAYGPRQIVTESELDAEVLRMSRRSTH